MSCKHSAQSWYIDEKTGRQGCYDCDNERPSLLAIIRKLFGKK